MTTRPELYRGSKTAGLAAVALFLVLGYVFLGAGFEQAAGFASDATMTSGIGYLMFDLVGATQLGSEGFLAAFEIVDIVLVGALVGAVMLARREDDDPIRADGGDEGGER